MGIYGPENQERIRISLPDHAVFMKDFDLELGLKVC